MMRTSACLLLLFSVLAVLETVHALVQDILDNPKYFPSGGTAIPGSYIVKLKESTNLLRDRAGIEAEYNKLVLPQEGELLETLDELFAGFAFQLKENVLETLLETIVERVLASDLVEYMEEDTQVTNFANVNCPGSWGLDRIDQDDLPLDGVYHYDWTGSTVNAYILDTGTRCSHDQFEGRALPGASFIVNEPNPCQDGNGHGTHTAGTVGSKDYGVAKQVTIYAVKVLSAQGSGATSGIVRGINWVSSQVSVQTSNKTSVINMSLGGSGYSQSTDDAIRAAAEYGILTVVAAGNDDDNACGYTPANAQYAATVASLDINDARSSFSNFGSCVDIFAPGRDITSTWSTSDTAIKTISGTSMASPHIAGLAALYWEENPSLTVAQLAAKIRNTSSFGQVTDSQSRKDEIGVSVSTFTTQVGTYDGVCKYSAAFGVTTGGWMALVGSLLVLAGSMW